MAGVVSKLLSWAGVYQDPPTYEDEYYPQGDDNVNGGGYYEDDGYQNDIEQQDRATLNQQLRNQSGDRSGNGGGNGARAGVKNGTNNVVNLHPQKQNKDVLVLAKPDNLEDAQTICSRLKDRNIVIVNVEGVDGREAQRIVDFIIGVAYALDGEILHITNRIFAVTPNYVELVSIQRDTKKRGFSSFVNGESYR